MPKAPGWAVIATNSAFSSTGTGPTLDLLTPPDTVANDILIAMLSHKSAGYATPPAGWTLVQQGIQGTTRGEMYWRRATAGEPAFHTFGGLSTSVSGAISGYKGGLLAGNIVAVSSVRSVASGNSAGAAGITTTGPNQLLIAMIAMGSNTSIGFLSTASGLPFPLNGAIDGQVGTKLTRINDGTGSGGGTRIAFSHWMKTVAGPTGDSTASGAADHVCIFAAFIPETAAATAGTRYYFTADYPKTHLFGRSDGDWDSTADGPRGTPEIQGYVHELRQIKSDGSLFWSPLFTNNLDQHNFLWYRFVTPLLSAQAINTTFDLNLLSACGWAGGVQTPSDPTLTTGVYKAHVYISQGDAVEGGLAVRQVLLDNYIDATLLDNSGASRYQGFTTPQTLSGTALEGDRIVFELGIRILDSPLPPPNLPPDEWSYMSLERGTSGQSGVGLDANLGMAYPDADSGIAGSQLVGYLSLSQTLTEQAPSGTIPTNTDAASAIAIGPSLPVHLTVETSQVPVAMRQIWYKWTAPSDQRVIAHLFGSYCHVFLDVWESASLNFVLIPEGKSRHTYLSRTVDTFDALGGHTYYFRITTASTGFLDAAPASGGHVEFTLTPYVAPTNNTVYVATASYVLAYQETTLIGVTTRLDPAVISGIGIDYSKRPMDNQNGGTHALDRLLVVGYADLFVDILDIATLNIGEADVDFIQNPFYETGATAFHMASVACDLDGIVVVGFFGDGFRRVAGQSNSWQDRASSGAAGAFNIVDVTNGDNQAGAPYPLPTYRVPTLEAGGTNYLEYALDQGSVFYTSADWYFPSAGGHVIRRYDIANGVQLADFATVPAPAGAITPSVKGLFPIPGGGILVCNGNVVVRLDETGTIVQTYTPTPDYLSQSLADVELTVEGDAFWVLDELSTTLFKFDLLTGDQLAMVWTKVGFGACTSLCVYRKDNPFLEGVQPPQPEGPAACPAGSEFPIDPGSDTPGCDADFPVDRVN